MTAIQVLFREAQLRAVESKYSAPSVSSTTPPSNTNLAAMMLEALEEIKDFFICHDLLKKNSIYNINIPLNYKGICITRMGERSFIDEFLPQGNDMYLSTYKEILINSDDKSIDKNATASGYISVTPLMLNRTNMSIFEELVKLND